MAYEEQTWTNVHGETPITAEKLNHMEKGITDASKTGGVEVGTIVHIEDDAPVPEGYVEVTDEDEITLVDPSELFTISEGFTLLFDSNIYKHRNRYFGDITIQKDEGNFDEWGNTVATFKKTMIGMCNTGCFLCAGQWNTNVVGHCFIGATEISVANKTGVNNYNVAKIKFDVVSNETNATKPIEKKSVTPVDPKTGHIYDTTNIDNKAENTYSANVIDGLVETKEITMTVEDGAEKSLFKGGRSGNICFITFRIDTKKQFNSWDKLATLSSNGGAFTYIRITGHYFDTSNANNVLLPLNLGPDGVISPIINIPNGAEIHVCASYIGKDE